MMEFSLIGALDFPFETSHTPNEKIKAIVNNGHNLLKKDKTVNNTR